MTLVGHTVEGGCHVEYRSEGHIQAIAYNPGPVLGFTCDLHLEARIGEGGSGYVTEVEATTEPGGTCDRAPCDEASHEMIPWPIQVTENAGTRTAHIELCLRPSAGSEGSPGLNCTLHLPFIHRANHDHSIGTHTERRCENLPTVAIRNMYLVNESEPSEGTEDIYLTPWASQLEALQEGPSEHCPPVERVDETVEGGCHLELAAEHSFQFVIYMPNPVALYECSWHIEARIDENGAGYATATFGFVGFPPPCTLPACAGVPWPLQFRETGGSESIELEACLGSNLWCSITLPLIHTGGHGYAAGAADDYVCALSASLVFSFNGVLLVNEEDPMWGTEDIELVH